MQKDHLMQPPWLHGMGCGASSAACHVVMVQCQRAAGRLRFAAAGLQAFSGTWLVSLRTDIGPSSRTVRGHENDNESAGTASGWVYLQTLHCSEQ